MDTLWRVEASDTSGEATSVTVRNALKTLHRKVFGPVPRASSLNYAHDGLFTVHNADFMNDQHFQSAYRSGKLTGSWGNADLEWRLHVCLFFAAQAARLDGDFVECGTNRGGTATSILTYLADHEGFVGKTFYCFDTFQGLAPERSSAAEIEHYAGMYEDCYDEVAQHFAAFPQVQLVRGPIPDTLRGFQVGSISFLHIDMNSAEPERAAIDFFWPHLTSGAFVLLDDFGWESCIDQRTAFIQFASEANVGILWLPTGQGLLQKP